MIRQSQSRVVSAILVTGLFLGAASCSRSARRHDITQTTPHEAPIPSVPAISGDELLRHITILADDQLEGRGTGSEGIDLAAGYLAAEFAAAGVKPGGDGNSYFQKFEIPGDPKISAATSLKVSNLTRKAELQADFVPLSRSAEGAFDAPLIFAGYGMTDSEKKYDDYEGLDVAGRVVLVFRGAPPQLKSDPAPRERALFDKKIERAVELDVAAILFVDIAPESEASQKLLPFGRRSRVAEVPLIHVSRSMTDEVLTAAGLPTLKTLQESIDSGTKASQPVPGVSVSGSVVIEKVVWPSRNVIGLVRGSGPNADEYVVIGAHYDHLGIQDGKIHNGADDNASGTSAVVEICEAIAKVPTRNRSLLCMAFTGEEIGLLGSEHYAANSTVPIQSVTAMINLDMIGRWTPGVEENELAIQGLGTGDSFQQIVDRHTQPAGIKYLPDPSAKGPSDHASFYESKVPSLFFFTGVHEDYHRPGDDVEKINAAGAAQIATLVGNVTLDLLNTEQRPKFQTVEKQARIFRGPPPSPVVMGIMPDPEQDSSKPGWLIGEVVPTGGASKAGMKAGDRILTLDGSQINKLADYYKATANKKAGDVVSVVVRRGSEEVTLQIELAARGGS